eukprot:CAMPEP_0115152658 /NCGR_PEP_ID=MMETSP0227-20121206/66284_1 /TAXON_ID=89957 /ORGANISM="Polarella glacialis, Strain CCMP 1383" /LENGTH=613 /DNA_ID=CAMNT_0002563293 /DNA_START=287 /DNA_END=2136 /DNA_ORIENTATION=-
MTAEMLWHSKAQSEVHGGCEVANMNTSREFMHSVLCCMHVCLRNVSKMAMGLPHPYLKIFCLWQRMLMSQRHAKVELRQANCTPCQAQTQSSKTSEVLCHEPLLPPDSLGTRDRLPRHFPPRFLLTTATTPTTATTTSLSPGAGGGGAAGRAAQATGWAAAGVYTVPFWKGCPGIASASSSSVGVGRHAILEQLAPSFDPFRGHEHVLQPSSAGKRRPGQHTSSSAAGGTEVEATGAGTGVGGADGQERLVHSDSLTRPLHGQVQVFGHRQRDRRLEVRTGQKEGLSVGTLSLSSSIGSSDHLEHRHRCCSLVNKASQDSTGLFPVVQRTAELAPQGGQIRAVRFAHQAAPAASAGVQAIPGRVGNPRRAPPNGNSAREHAMSVQLDSFFNPLGAQVQVLQARPYSKPGQHRSSVALAGITFCAGCTAGSAAGQGRLVQLDSFIKPLRLHVKVFKPSPAGWLPMECNGQVAALMAAENFRAGRSILQAAGSAVAGVAALCVGQAWAAVAFEAAGSSEGGSRGQTRLVHLASLLRPLLPQVQVFKPSPAGYATPGLQWPAGSDPGGFAGQAIFVQPAAVLEPSVGQLQVLQPSSAVKGRPGQQEASLGDEASLV